MMAKELTSVRTLLRTSLFKTAMISLRHGRRAPGRPRRRSRKSTDRRAAELSRSRGFFAALSGADCIPEVGHSRRGDGVDQLQADLPELDGVE
jgi:hypothetical protein